MRVYALLLGAAGLLLVPGQAWAQCVQSGSVVTCSGNTSGNPGFDGTGQTGLTVNVLSGATVSSPTDSNADQAAIASGVSGSSNTLNNSGAISGGRYGVHGPATIQNSGTIFGVQFGVAAGNPDNTFGGNVNLTNNTGTITGGQWGIYASRSVTGINFGTIQGEEWGIQTIYSDVAITNYGLIKGQWSIDNGGSIGPHFGPLITNYGTLDGAIRILLGNTSPAATVTNNGLITISNTCYCTNTDNYITGIFTQAPTGTLQLNANPHGADRFNVIGTANFGGTLIILLTPGSYGSSTTYANVLNSTNPITSQFSKIISSSPFYSVTATNQSNNPYTDNSIGRTFNYSLDLTLTQTLFSYSRLGNANLNEQGIGQLFDRLYSSNSSSAASDFFAKLNASTLPTPLTQLTGEAGAHGGSHAATHMMGSFLTLVLNPFGGSPGGNPGSVGVGRGFAAEQELSPDVAQAYAAVTPKDRRLSSAFDRRWGIWGQAYGGLNKTNGDTSTGTHDTTARSYGFANGADYRVSADAMVGFALAGGGMQYGLADGLGGGKSDVFQMGVYGSKQFGAAYVSAALSYAWQGMKTDRTVTISGTDNLTASFNAQSFGGRLESGYRFIMPFGGVTPYAALQVQNFKTPPYSEIATSGLNTFALSYDAKSTTSTRAELGAWFDKMIALDRGNVLAIRTRVAWAHDFSNDESVGAAFQSLPGSTFTTNGAASVPNSALLSAGAEIWLASGVSFGAKFDGDFASRSQTYTGTGTVRYVW